MFERYLIVAVKEFVRIIVRCLIKLRAVKFVSW